MSDPKSVSEYRSLPYTRRVELVREDSGEEYFVARIVELPGVEADGDTPYEARYRLESAFLEYLKAMVEWGETIPRPNAWPEGYDTSQDWSPSDDSSGSEDDEPVGEFVDPSELDPARELVPSGSIG